MQFKISFFKTFVTLLLLVTVSLLLQSFRVSEENAGSVPDDAVMSFSYDLRVQSYAQLEREEDKDKLKPHQKFQFVPKSERIHVQGYLRSDGFPHIEIDVLEKSDKTWLRKTLSNPDTEIKVKELKKLVIDNGRFIAYDARGEKIYEKEEPLFNFKDKAEFFIKNLDAEKVYKEMIANFIKRGAKVTTSGNYLNINYDANGLNYDMELLKDKALPSKSIIKSTKEITTTTYTYECIDGKWVLVITKTRIEPNKENADVTDVPVINNFITEIENVNINTL